MAAGNAQIGAGDTVAIRGCGPVGQFAIRSVLTAGAGRRAPGASSRSTRCPSVSPSRKPAVPRRSITLQTDVYDGLQARSRGRDPDSCIDAVDCEAAVMNEMKTA
jgi:threonine dehydrogenase-like Zn-dependent dehydrogenase